MGRAFWRQRYLGRVIKLLLAIGIIVFTGVVTRQIMAVPPTAGLVGYWALDEASGTVANDSSGLANNGTLVNSPVRTTGTNCKSGGCLQFTSNTSRVDIPYSATVNTTTGFTVAFWYRATSNSGSIFAKPLGTGTLNSWQLEFRSNTLSFTSSGGSANDFDSITAPATGAWHFVAASWDGTNKKIYLDGTLRLTQARAISFDTKGLVIGGDYNGGSFALPYKGYLDDVRLYNRALTAAEVTELYNPAPPDTTPPVITGVASSAVTSSTATIGWTTNEASSTQVEYGLTTAYGTLTTLNPTLVTAHSQGLTGLAASTLYHYRVRSKDAAGNEAISTDFSFTTATPPDTTPPVISGVTSNAITTNSATISWTTNEASSTQVEYGLTTAYGTLTTLNPTLVTAHSQSLTGLTASTLYHYRVRSKDAAGNEAISTDFSFTTATPPDTTPPVISGVASSAVTSSAATISWTTDDASSSQVEYGTTTAYGNLTTLDPALVTAHSQILTGLTASTLYHYRVRSKDAAGNEAISTDFSFTTAAPPDTTPPVISGVASSAVTSSAATINWTTDEASSSQVEYGTTTAYGNLTTLDPALVTAHSQILTGLTASTLYHYRVRSKDAAGNEAISTDFSFTTAAPPDTTPPVISGVASSAVTSSAATINWTTDDASSSQVEYGTTTAYGNLTTLDPALVTAHSQILTGLTASTLYHYRVRSKDAAGNEAISTDFSFTTAAPPDTTPPVISDVTSGTVTHGSATINWTTDEASSSQVEYGTTLAYGNLTILDATPATIHSQILTGLAASTLYHYRVRSKDAAGNEAISTDFSFTTAVPPDTTPPVISDVSSNAITTSAATISWTTDEASSSQVEYGTTTAYGSLTTFDATPATNHSQALSGLAPSTLYHYRVRSKDAAGNEAISTDFSFTTAVPPDTTPPVISGVTSSAITSSAATISWTTDEASSSQVEYGTTTAYGSLTTFDATPATNHSQALSGLAPSTLYHYRVRSKDAAGNEAISTDFSFTTAAPPDTTPPVINDVTSNAITTSAATISWTTDEAATTQVEYGLTTAYGSLTTLDPALVTNHSQALTGLIPDTLYHYRVRSRDAAGNEAVSADFSFTTAVAPPDTTPPVISNVTSSLVTSGTATIGWATDEAATTEVEYGLTTAYGNLTTLDATPVTNHSQALSGLAPSTLYHYRVRSKDAAGNEAISTDFSFTTAAPPDTTPPVINDVTSNAITTGAATISWTTDEASSSQVEYGTTTAYGSLTTFDATPVTNHSQALSGLAPSTLYHYRVRSKDAAGNEAISTDFSFTTAVPPDTTPPVISGVASSAVTSSAATINWTTDEASSSQVEYGTTTAYGNLTTLDPALVTAHSQILTGLTASTLYHYRVRSKDAAGNEAISTDFSFTTAAPPDTTPPVISGVTSSAITSSAATISWTTDEASSSQIEYGTTTAYGNLTTFDATPVTNHSQALSGLAPSTLYHYRVRSKDAAGNEAISTDFSFTTAALPDTTPPVISGVASSAITSSAATIGWTTDEAATTQVEYGLTTAYGNLTTLDPASVTAHTQNLAGLTGNTVYHYRVRSRDAAGNEAVSPDFSFTTATPPDTTPPVISGVASSAITTSAATINWTTDEASSSRIEYGTTTAYGSLTTLDVTLVTTHSQALSSLTPSTLYHYRVRSKDAAGNEAVSADFSFTTAAPPDTTPPVISGVASNAITSTSAAINWTTNEAATTQVEYGLTTAYGNLTTLNASLVTAHAQGLSGLAASTLYHYRVKSRDAAGNESVSSDFNFTTTAPPDITPPVISNVITGSINNSSATIIWVTNEAATTQVEYGLTTAYGSLTSLNADAILTTGHNQTITGLTANTLYHYRVRSHDSAGNEAVSADFTFTTLATAAGNFQTSIFVSGVVNPTAIEFAQDGRLFISEIAGRLRVVKNGQLLTAPFLTVDVATQGEQGLLGIAFAPDFSTNGYVYVYYTARTPAPHNRLSRFTANGDVAAAGSELVLLDLPAMGNIYHNGGAIHFGPDGKLYVAIGDHTNSSNAQLLTNPFGKILRLNPDGSIPTDNPFYGQTTGIQRAIWAYGLRNPFTFDVDPVTGRIFVNDVGQDTWEEVNQLVRGANYGWPTCEGPQNSGVGTCNNPAFTYPLHAYAHTVGSAIAGGVFYRASQFPSQYFGTYFFGDYTGGWIKYLDTPNQVPGLNNPATSFTSLQFVVDLKVGPDGALYVPSIYQDNVRKIEFITTGNRAPTAVAAANPIFGAAPLTVNFNGSSSSDPDLDPLTYSWDFGDGSAAGSGVSVNHAYQNPGPYNATLTVNDGHGGIDSEIVQISVGTSPQGTIITPATGTFYNAGDTVSFSGSGTDAEDGVLPASRFSWTVVFHHDDHTHPFLGPINGVTGGSFQIPQTGESSANTWYQIILTVTDSTGLTKILTRNISPNTVSITLDSNIPGLLLTLDGQPLASPLATTGVVGFIRSIGAPSPQTLTGRQYEFVSWSDGGLQTHNITTPGAGVTYTAEFRELPDTIPPAISGVASAAITSGSAVINWTTDEASSSRVEYGTTTSYGSSTTIDSALVTAHSQSLTGLAASTLYHYRVRSIDAAGNETVSADFSFTTAAPPDTTPPVISGVASNSITSNAATINWTTNETATTQVEYGLTTAYGTLTTLDATLVTTHIQTLTGLTASTLYHYRVRSKDAAGNETVSPDFSFTTTATPDTTPPVISAVASSAITSSAATIGWTTNETATTQVEYGLTTAYGTLTTLNSSLVTTHSQGLAGLAASTLYHYRVRSKDAAGNEAISADFSFTTAAPPDTTPPVISAVASSAISSSTATITWTTNEASTTQVEYGLTTAYGTLTTLNSSLVTAHSQGLTGLAASTLYHYRVRSKDAAGNEAISADFSFTTAAPPDTIPPVISAVASSAISSSTATITWTTNEASTTQVEYGLTTAYGTLTTLNSSLVTAHSQGLTGLAASTLYHYRVRSKDAAGNEAISADFSFTTIAAGQIGGLVGYWNLNETSGTVATDSSGNGNNGTLVNSPVRATGTNCKFGGCLQFTSNTSRVDIPYSATINTTTGFTVAFWYRATSNSGSIFAKPLGTGTLNTWQLEFNGSTLSFTSSNGSAQSFDSITAPATGAWHFVVATWDGTNKKLYLDGTLRLTQARAISFDTKALVIGGDYNGGSFVLPYKGYIDDVRLYNRALTDSEVLQLFNQVN